MTLELEAGVDVEVPVDVRPREPISQGNPVLVETGAQRATGDRSCWTWCPACLHVHQWVVERRAGSALGPSYGWDGNRTRPTFTPALSWTAQADNGATLRCRAQLKAGIWLYLDGCTHGLAGQSLPIVPVPNWLRDVT